MNNELIDNNLSGLLMPPEVEGFNTPLWTGLIIAICILSFALWYWQKYRSNIATIAHKKIVALENQTHQKIQKSPQESTQETMIQLTSILCQGLGVKRLDMFKTEKKHEWEMYQKKLASACYSSDSKLEIVPLFTEAKKWLRDR